MSNVLHEGYRAAQVPNDKGSVVTGRLSNYEVVHKHPGNLGYDDIIYRFGILMLVLIGGAGAGAFVVYSSPQTGLVLSTVAFIVAFGCSLATIFFTKHIKPLAMVFAGSEGMALGALAVFSISQGDSYVSAAIGATFITFIACYAAYALKIIRVGNKFRKFLFVALIAVIAVMLVNVMVGSTLGIMNSPLFHIGVILIAAFLLIRDFEDMQRAVTSGSLNDTGAWLIAYSLTVSLVWIYVEFFNLFRSLNK